MNAKEFLKAENNWEEKDTGLFDRNSLADLLEKYAQQSNRLDGVVIKGDSQPVPNGGSEVITIDLIMLNAVKQCQKVLAEWIVPDSKTTDADCLNKLLEIVDDKSLVQYMNTIESNLIK
jgi:hypothetical protein